MRSRKVVVGMAARESLGKVELELLQLVAKLQPVSVRTLVEHLSDSSGQARTTILTTLERLRKKGYLSRRKINGANHYAPRVPVADLLQQLVGDFVSRVLGGSVSPFVAYLQDARQVPADELAQLKAVVDQLEQREQRPRNDA